MARYASKTEVSVEKSRAEIEQTIIRYGASEFLSGWKSQAAMIGFRLKGLSIRFVLPIPDRKDNQFAWTTRRGYKARATDAQSLDAYEQEVRRRWRALYLVIKAKLEAVESKISTIEEEFMAHIVMPNDMTIGEWIIQQALPHVRAGNMPLAISGPKEDPKDEPVDAEIVKTTPRESHA